MTWRTITARRRPYSHVTEWHQPRETRVRNALDDVASNICQALQYGDATPATRGNEALAKQDCKPADMSKPEFLAFGAFRSYPNLQAEGLLRTSTRPTLWSCSDEPSPCVCVRWR